MTRRTPALRTALAASTALTLPAAAVLSFGAAAFAPTQGHAQCLPAAANNTASVCAADDTDGFGTGVEDNATLTVNETVTVTRDPGAGAVVNLDDNAVVTNNGTIQGDNNSDAIEVSNNGTVTNNGTITGVDEGVVAFDGLTLTNNGAINTEESAIRADDGATIVNEGSITTTTNQDAVTIDENGSVTNNGTINATTGDQGIEIGNGSVANTGGINGQQDGVEFDKAGVSSVTNSGSIVGQTQDGVEVVAGGVTLDVQNTGTIAGSVTGIDGNSGVETVENMGRIESLNGTEAFDLSGGDDVVNQNPDAEIVGILDGGADNDTLNFQGVQNSVVNVQSVETVNPGPNTLFDGRDATGTGLVAVMDPTMIADETAQFEQTIDAISDTLERRRGAIKPLGDAPAAAGNIIAGSFDADLAASGDVDDVAAALSTFSIQSPLAKNNALWLEGFGVARERDGALQDLESTTLGVMGGYSFRLTALSDAGVFGGWARTETDTDTAGQEVDSDSLFVGGFIGTYFQAVRVDATLYGGYSDYDSERRVSGLAGNQIGRAEYNGWFLAPELSASTQFDFGRVSIVPSAMIGYALNHTDGYTESGVTSPMTVGDRTTHLFRGRLAVDAPITVAEGALNALAVTPRLGVEGAVTSGDDADVTWVGVTQSLDTAEDDTLFRGFAGLELSLVGRTGSGASVSVEGDTDFDDGVGGSVRFIGRLTF